MVFLTTLLIFIVGLGQDSILSAVHPDAPALFNVDTSLERVSINLTSDLIIVLTYEWHDSFDTASCPYFIIEQGHLVQIINKLHLIIWALIYVDQLTVCPFISAVIFSKSHEAMR